jgi:hypothetical protein
MIKDIILCANTPKVSSGTTYASSSNTTASTNRGTPVSQAFNTSGSYFIFGTTSAGNYLQVSFGFAVSVTQVTYRNAVGSSWAPTSVKIRYSNDGSTWNDAVTYSDNASTSLQTISVSGGSGSYWQLYQNSSTRAGSGGYEWHMDSFSMTGSYGLVNGQISYTVPGTYTWVCPQGITSVCAVAIGGGSGGCHYTGGAGGGLSYQNNISVTPGQSYTVVVGAGAVGTGWTYGKGGDSSVFGMVAGGGGTIGGLGYNSTPPGGVGNAGTGGLGEGYFRNNSVYNVGGSGAGGYGYNGGVGTYITSSHGNGNGGGGTGIFGGTVGGSGGTYGFGNAGYTGSGGAGGSGGTSGGLVTGWTTDSSASSGSGTPGSGGLYGGGGGSGCGYGYVSSTGGNGAIRIIWGAGRAFPNTLTGDL